MEVKKQNWQDKNKPKTNFLQYAKVPPQSKEIEEAVLGAIMLEKQAFENVNDILTADCFYVDAHQEVYKSMQSLAIKRLPIDMTTVVEELKLMGKLGEVGGPYAIMKFTNNVVSSANIEAHSRIVKQKFLLRELIKFGGELVNEGFEDSTDVFDLLDKSAEVLSNLQMGHATKNYRSISNIAFENIKELERLRALDEEITGVETGFDDLDMVTCGWQPGDLIILAARPSVGKTAFALTLAKKAASCKNPISVGFFSLEMKDKQLVDRMLSQESGVWLHKFRNGKMGEQEQKKIYDSANNFKNVKVFVDETHSLNINAFKIKARLMKRKENVGLIIIDYLQLMSGTGDKNGNREQEISKITRELKGMAKELSIPIIALSQLSRDIEKTGTKKREPQLSDLRESGAIEQDADLVMFLYKPSENEMEEDANLLQAFNAFIAKHRNGQLAKFVGKFIGETQTHKYLKVLDSKTFLPNAKTWTPVNSIDFSKSKKELEEQIEDNPF